MYQYIDKFKDFSKITEDDKKELCIYYASNGGDEEGFTNPIMYDDLGITMFICQKYIRKSTLDTLKDTLKGY